MKEHNRTDRLTLITILFVIVIGVVLITYRAPRLNYEQSTDDLLSALNQTEHVISVEDAKAAMEDGKTVFVDLRSKNHFVVNHIENAVNIPLMKILDEESIDLFDDDDKTYVLYAQDHLAANGPWMLLKQLGVENTKVLLGGYDNFMNYGKEYPEFYESYEDLTAFEYTLNSELENLGKRVSDEDNSKVEEAKKSASKPKVVAPKKKVSVPKVVIPVEEEEEEEEGC